MNFLVVTVNPGLIRPPNADYKVEIARKLKCLGAVVALMSLIAIGAFAALFVMVADLQNEVLLENPKGNYLTSKMNDTENNLYSSLQRIKILTKELEDYNLNSSLNRIKILTKELEDYHLKISRLAQNQSKLLEESGIYIASNERAYKLHKSAKSYHDAKSACESTGAMLASVGIRNSGVRSELLRFLKKDSFPSICETKCMNYLWIGLSYTRRNDTWMWLDGISNDTTINWGPNQPGNAKNEDCAVIYGNNEEIHDYSCDDKFYYLCEIEITN